jgi:hypothetical protein
LPSAPTSMPGCAGASSRRSLTKICGSASTPQTTKTKVA